MFTESSTDAHMGWFHLSATVNNDAIIMGVHISFPVSVLNSFGHIPRSGIAESYGASILFEKLPYCFPQQLCHFTFLSAMHKGSNFSTSLPSLIWGFFNSCHPNKWYLTMVLICIPGVITDAHLASFHVLVGHLYNIPSLEKCLLKSFVHFPVGLFVLLLSCRILYIFWISILFQIYDLQILSPIPWVAFSLYRLHPSMNKFLILM